MHRKVVATLENIPPSAPSDGEVDVLGGGQAGAWQLPPAVYDYLAGLWDKIDDFSPSMVVRLAYVTALHMPK